VNEDIVKIREQLADPVAECNSQIQAESEVFQRKSRKARKKWVI